MRAHVAADLKEHNRRVVYDLMRSKLEISRAEIARRCGISAPTVIKIIDYYSMLGMAGEAGEGESALGRKPILIRFNPDAAFAVGAEYDGVHLTVGLVDLAGSICALRRSPAPPDLQRLLGPPLAAEVEALLAEAGIARELVKGMGVGVPGVVDPIRRTLSLAPLVGVEESVDYGPPAGELVKALGFPVIVTNDANAAALGELSARGGREGDDLIFIELGRGVGAGIVMDGHLRIGPRFSAGEIGYMVCERGPRSGKGEAGWLETGMDLGSFWDEAVRDGEPSPASLDRVAELLALALANICIVLDLACVVVGRAGEESFGPALLERLRTELARICPMPVACEPPVSPGPGVAGAAALAMQSWLEGIFAG